MDYLVGFSWIYHEDPNDQAQQFFAKLKAGIEGGKSFPINKPHQIALYSNSYGTLVVGVLVLSSYPGDESREIFKALEDWFIECGAWSVEDRSGRYSDYDRGVALYRPPSHPRAIRFWKALELFQGHLARRILFARRRPTPRSRRPREDGGTSGSRLSVVEGLLDSREDFVWRGRDGRHWARCSEVVLNLCRFPSSSRSRVKPPWSTAWSCRLTSACNRHPALAIAWSTMANGRG
jgi:hypothetical protein